VSNKPRFDFRNGNTFSVFLYDETPYGAHQTNTVGKMGTSLGVKRTGREVAN